MGKYSLANSGLSESELIGIFEEYYRDDQSLKTIFQFALANKERFPNIHISDKVLITGIDINRAYIRKWCSDYLDYILPSKRSAPLKTTPDDPALIKMIESYASMTNAEADESLKQHNLWMSAENIQGELLEEYIAQKTSPLGWIWCKGSILRAIDFMSFDGTFLLQIKNKFNTENSSSSAIRDGSDIKKWFRLGKTMNGGKTEPSFKWDILNYIIDCGSNGASSSNMSEEDYEDFLSVISRENPHLLK